MSDAARLEQLQQAALVGMSVAFHASEAPERMAVESKYGARTFGELNGRVNQLVRVLRAAGVGHDDGVAPDEWVAWEYAKVRRHYTKLGLAGKTEIEFFNGPHRINAEGTFRFLRRHLDWPEPD